MTCPNMGCCQGEGSRKGHKVSRQNNYKVRHEKWALPGTSRRCATLVLLTFGVRNELGQTQSWATSRTFYCKSNVPDKSIESQIKTIACMNKR